MKRAFLLPATILVLGPSGLYAGSSKAPSGTPLPLMRLTPVVNLTPRFEPWEKALAAFFSRAPESREDSRALSNLRRHMAGRHADHALLAPLRAAIFTSPEQFNAAELSAQRSLLEMVLKRAAELVRARSSQYVKAAEAESTSQQGLERLVRGMDYWHRALRIYGRQEDADDYARALKAARARLGRMRSERIVGEISGTAAALGNHGRKDGPDEGVDAEHSLASGRNGGRFLLALLREGLDRAGSASEINPAVIKTLSMLALQSRDKDIQRAVAKTLVAALKKEAGKVRPWRTDLILDLHELALFIPDEGVQRIVIRGLLREMRAVDVESGAEEPLTGDFQERWSHKRTLALMVEHAAAASAFDNIREIAIHGFMADPSFSGRLLSSFADGRELLAAVERLAVGARSRRLKALAVGLILRELGGKEAGPLSKGELLKAVDRISDSAEGLFKMEIPEPAIGLGRAIREHHEAAAGNFLGLAGILLVAAQMGLPLAASVTVGLALAYIAILGLRTDQPAAGFLQMLFAGGFSLGVGALQSQVPFAPTDLILCAFSGAIGVWIAVLTLKGRQPWLGIVVNLLSFGGILSLLAWLAG